MNNEYNADLLVNENSIIAAKFPEYCSSFIQTGECILLLEDVLKKVGASRHVYDIDICNLGQMVTDNHYSTFNLNLFIKTEYNSYSDANYFKYDINYGDKSSHSYFIPKLYIEKTEDSDAIITRVYIESPIYNVILGIKSNLVYPKMCNTYICNSPKRYNVNELTNLIETITEFTTTFRDIMPLETDKYKIGKKRFSIFFWVFHWRIKNPYIR